MYQSSGRENPGFGVKKVWNPLQGQGKEYNIYAYLNIQNTIGSEPWVAQWCTGSHWVPIFSVPRKWLIV